MANQHTMTKELLEKVSSAESVAVSECNEVFSGDQLYQYEFPFQRHSFENLLKMT
jgi:hypothetical protein